MTPWKLNDVIRRCYFLNVDVAILDPSSILAVDGRGLMMNERDTFSAISRVHAILVHLQVVVNLFRSACRKWKR